MITNARIPLQVSAGPEYEGLDASLREVLRSCYVQHMLSRPDSE